MRDIISGVMGIVGAILSIVGLIQSINNEPNWYYFNLTGFIFIGLMNLIKED